MPKAERIALVIGCSAYEPDKLPNPVRDAALITHRLKLLGFKVYGGASSEACETGLLAGADLTQMNMVNLIGEFMGGIAPGAEVVIYYAGHALQVGDQNFLMPVGCQLDEAHPELGLVNIKSFIKTAAGRAGTAGTVVAFLDACRNNPLDPRQVDVILGRINPEQRAEHGQREAAAAVLARGGLSTVKMDRNGKEARTFIGFATAPGDVACDGKKGSVNSPFAERLDQHLATRGLEIEELYNRVGKDVLDQVDAELSRYQDPWSETNLNRTFCIHKTNARPVIFLGLAGLIVGLIIGYCIFANGKIVTPVSHWAIWGLGALFGVMSSVGTMIWGSKRPIDAFFAFFGPTVGFALALALLQIIPPFDVGRPPPRSDRPIAEGVYTYVTLFGGLLFYLGTALVWKRNLPDWPHTFLQWLNRFLTFALPLIVVLVLLRLQHYLSQANPLLAVIAIYAVLGGVIYTASMALALRAQRGLFGQFGPFTGAISVGLLMSAFFAVFVAITGSETNAMPRDQANLWLIGLGALWHMLLGAQLGYCFAYYVPDHQKWAPKA